MQEFAVVFALVVVDGGGVAVVVARQVKVPNFA